MDYETITVGVEGSVGTLALDYAAHAVDNGRRFGGAGGILVFVRQALACIRSQRASTWVRVVQVEPTEMRA